MIDFTTDAERKRLKQIEKVENIVWSARDAISSRHFGFSGVIARRLIKLRNYLNREFPIKDKTK